VVLTRLGETLGGQVSGSCNPPEGQPPSTSGSQTLFGNLCCRNSVSVFVLAGNRVSKTAGSQTEFGNQEEGWVRLWEVR
jgi:hypothetical protein